MPNPMNGPAPHLSLLTALSPGAVGLIGLYGPGVQPLLKQLTAIDDWPIGHLKLVSFDGIDQGLVACLRHHPSPKGVGLMLLMPHSGPRVVRKLIDRLIALGAAYEPFPLTTPQAIDPATTGCDTHPQSQWVYPEASSTLEADMLTYLAQAASPRAIDLLLAQPKLWSRWLGQHTKPNQPWRTQAANEILRHSDKLDQLIVPPTVVVVGQPNVGKSTLTNHLLGRTASLVADLPGTTRDWVACLAQIHGVALRWMDTPGLRVATDTIERSAIERARQAIENAHVLIAMRDPATGWPDPCHMTRCPDLWVMNKIDLAPSPHASPSNGQHHGQPLTISATTGQGIDRLQQQVLRCLGLEPQPQPPLWAFSHTLRSSLTTGQHERLAQYTHRV